ATGTDFGERHGGRASASLTATGPDTLSRSLMETFPAGALAGHRVRLSAFAKSLDVKYEAGLRMYVDGRWRLQAYDGMRQRPIRGTTGWRRYDLVLDVPQNARQISVGGWLTGSGKLWVDDLSLEAVPRDVVTTGSPKANRGLGAVAH